jgi:uncharacterized lipoprotein YajG
LLGQQTKGTVLLSVENKATEEDVFQAVNGCGVAIVGADQRRDQRISLNVSFFPVVYGL